MFSVNVIVIFRQIEQIHQHGDIFLLFIGGTNGVLDGPLVPSENG